MLFRKLFQILVLGGAAIGTTTGCSSAQGQQGTDKPDARPPATTADGGTASPQGSNDKGTADAGGGGVQGW